MRKYRTIILLAIFLFAGAVPIGLFAINAGASKTTTLPNYQPIDLGPKIRESNYLIKNEFKGFSSPVPKTSLVQQIPEPKIGETRMWLSLDDYMGYYFFANYTLLAESKKTQIWVQEDLSWPKGDPRASPIITSEQLNYLLNEFDNKIYATDTGYFGVTDFHNGSDSLLEGWGYFPPGYYADSEGRNVILVSNIRDENYYNSSYPYYIAGFYSPSLEAYHDRNIITIDCYDWIHRIGAEGYSWVQGEFVDHPYLYESVIAHEFQHLIHDDYIPNSVTWMNEGCSMFAEPLCGYPIDKHDIESFLATPDNSLNNWGDQGGINILADYGAVLLWSLYLTSHYGFDFMGQYVQNGVPGIEGINNLLPKGIDFYDVFHDWKLANLINAKHGKYGYSVFDFNLDNLRQINIHEVSGRQIPWTTASEKFGETITILNYSTGKYYVSAFGTDYISFPDLRGLNLLKFDGDDFATYGWTWSNKFEGWYSGAENLYNALLVSEPYEVKDDDILTIDTWYSIEDYWDFGFVQVSTDGGETWTSLENEYTTLDHASQAHPDIVANLPGLTGTLNNFVSMNFNLSLYVGQKVLFGFRYMTDWATLYTGWVIKSASVGSKELTLTPVYPEADFQVTIIEKFTTHWGNTFYMVHDMILKSDKTEYGFSLAYASKRINVYLVVSPVMEKGSADYKFKVSKFPCHWWSLL
ncbi:MAG: hypothetical protein ACTSYF_08555 [Promethearchaeota archaeon]